MDASQGDHFGPGSGTQFMPVLTAVGEPGPSCGGSSGPRSRVMVMYYDARASGIGTTRGSAGYVAGGDKQFDVRLAQASACTRDAANRLIFASSQQLSRYTLSATPDHGIVKTAGYGYTAVNRAYSMFCGGSCAFTGDYVHLVPRVPYVQVDTQWMLTTAAGVDQTKLPAPAVVGVWADTRDAVLPTVGGLRSGLPAGSSAIDALPWDVYQPAGSGQAPCVNAGARDQNVYTAEYTPGLLFAAAPATYRPSNIPRAYPLYVENRSGQQRFYRLTIDPLANASFDYASEKKLADIGIGPYSSVTGEVIVAVGQTVPVSISIQEIDNEGTLVPNGAQTTVTLLTGGEAVPTSNTDAGANHLADADRHTSVRGADAADPARPEFAAVQSDAVHPDALRAEPVHPDALQ